MLECRRPFTVLKTCNFVATPVEVTITRADPARRLIIELDGQPAVQRYAELIGAKPEELAFAHFLANPLGLMIDDEPRLRSAVRPEGSALFFCLRSAGRHDAEPDACDGHRRERGQALAQAAVKLGDRPARRCCSTAPTACWKCRFAASSRRITRRWQAWSTPVCTAMARAILATSTRR